MVAPSLLMVLPCALIDTHEYTQVGACKNIRGLLCCDGRTCLFVVDQLVHAARAKSGAHGVNDGHAGVDVADELGLSLTGVSALFEQDDLGLLW